MKAWTIGLALVAACLTHMTDARAASPDDTRIAGPGASIVDSTGAKWTLSGGYIYVNGVRDPHSAHVAMLAYEDGKVWQENIYKGWWWKSRSSDVWAPTQGTIKSPLPPISAVVKGSNLEIHAEDRLPIQVIPVEPDCCGGGQLGILLFLTDGLGNASVPVSKIRSLGKSQYITVAQSNYPVFLSNTGTVFVDHTTHFSADNIDGYLFLLGGPSFGMADWSQIVSFQQSDPAGFNLFKSEFSSPSYIKFDMAERDGSGKRYIATTLKSPTVVASLPGGLYCDVDTQGYGNVTSTDPGSVSAEFVISSLTMPTP